MIKFGLKLWSDNAELFDGAVASFTSHAFDFVELYSSPNDMPHYAALEKLRRMPVTIHATHSNGFHEFSIADEEMKIWRQTVELADFFESSVIVVHPGRIHTLESFKENLARIDDPRIHIENMAGLDIDKNPMFGQKIGDLEKIRELKPICFDFEKAVKAACYQKRDYKEYIREALEKLQPTYFHLSGGDKTNPVDEHLELSASNFDLVWIKKVLEQFAKQGMLVFETPKRGGMENDIANMDYFRSL